MMTRRVLLWGLALCLLLGPIPGEAQPAGRVPRVGILDDESPEPYVLRGLIDPFRDGLRALGYVEGQNIIIEYRWAEGEARAAPRAVAILWLRDWSPASRGRAGTSLRRS